MCFHYDSVRPYLFLAVVILFPIGSVSAQTTLEEIVVTAQKREQNIQDIGISITAFSGNELENRGIENTHDLPYQVPGMSWNGGAGRSFTSFALRGVSQRSVSDHEEAPIALYVDGAYHSFVGGLATSFYDIERVEVLRGPQGTLFGRNATGGLIHLISARPTENFEGYGEVSYGSYDQIRFEGAVSGPLSETLSGRASVLFNTQDGFIENTIGPDGEEATDYNVRGQLLYQPNEDVEFHLKATASFIDSDVTRGFRQDPTVVDPGATGSRAPASRAEFVEWCNNSADFNAGFGMFNAPLPAGDPTNPFAVVPSIAFLKAGLGLPTTPPPGAEIAGNCYVVQEPGDHRDVAFNTPGEMRLEYYGITGTLDWDLNNGMTLTAVSDYQKMHKDFLEDGDTTPFTLFDFGQAADNWQFSQELRLAGSSDRLQWVAGLYYLHIEHDIASFAGFINNPNLLINQTSPTAQETDSYAVFGQIEYDFTPEWTGILGFRWTEDEKDFSLTGATAANGLCEFNATFGFVPIPGLGVFNQCDFLQNFSPLAGTVAFTGFEGSFSEGGWSGKAELDWKPNKNLLFFVSANRGIKAGGFNAGSGLFFPPSEAQYDPETLYSYEGGFKWTQAGGRTTLNGSVFYYDYKDFQTFVATGGALRIFNTDAKVRGVELELNTRPWEGWQFVLGASWMDGEQKDLVDAAGNPVGDVVMPELPEWTFNGTARYEWPMFTGNMGVQMTFSYRDNLAKDAFNAPIQRVDDLFLANARVDFTSGNGRWGLALGVENITDEDTDTGNADLSTFFGGTLKNQIPGRWFRGTVSYRWD